MIIFYGRCIDAYLDIAWKFCVSMAGCVRWNAFRIRHRCWFVGLVLSMQILAYPVKRIGESGLREWERDTYIHSHTHTQSENGNKKKVNVYKHRNIEFVGSIEPLNCLSKYIPCMNVTLLLTQWVFAQLPITLDSSSECTTFNLITTVRPLALLYRSLFL